MIACLTPSDKYIDENLSTLAYASKAKIMTNQPKINDDPKATKINDLNDQVKVLTKQLEKANTTIDFLNQMVNDPSKSTHIVGSGEGKGLNKEIEFIMEHPDGHVENQTLQKFLNEKFEQISELANINLM